MKKSLTEHQECSVEEIVPPVLSSELSCGAKVSNSGLGKFFKFWVIPTLLILIVPPFNIILSYMTTELPSSKPRALLDSFAENGFWKTIWDAIWPNILGTKASWNFFSCFCLIALLIYFYPGPVAYGPLTETGHRPEYTDNGVAHLVLFSALFFLGSYGLELYEPTIIFDVFHPFLASLSLFGLIFFIFITIKGVYFPSTSDGGKPGHSRFMFLFFAGTELYPRVGGVDLKKFINCRISMTFWMLSGWSFFAKSLELHDSVDFGLLFCTISTSIYLIKFFMWEIGYMRSIDIVMDYYGFMEGYGCVCFVPALYTLHMRCSVITPSGLPSWLAIIFFITSLSGVIVNYWADQQRKIFREKNGNVKIFGKPARAVNVQYSVLDPLTGISSVKTTKLLASGFWGIARHFQYVFELIAAWSWGLLGGFKKGLLPFFYPIFLTILLIHRAFRDEQKCLKKYGDGYREYMKIVKYRILPGIY
eukprot:gnl/Carplike_NY0171/2014_a2715_516.p1 GENE.gnl/Carplike_NY0171/2014_a2715_516~~gnl/Carplike_NY0171/2014_a2715_516.p1  ORF type:complete len:486 (-),score=42.40 gnl/Carplike_NY0171/2014_a2715_516:386-1813(-)